MSDTKWRQWPASTVFLLVTILATFPGSALLPGSLTGLQVVAADTPEQNGDAGDSQRLDPVDRYRLGLLRLKGHLGVARSLLQRREPGAAYHLQEPFETIFQEIKPVLQERNAPLTADTLDQLDRATDAAPQVALNILNDAASAIDGSFAQPGPLHPRSVLALSEALLREAVGLYEQSVVDNEVFDLHRYQTSRGFVIQAEALIRHSTGLSGQPGHEALLASVVLIRQAWPGVIPPPIVFDPQSVEDHLEDAIDAMDRLR